MAKTSSDSRYYFSRDAVNITPNCNNSPQYVMVNAMNATLVKVYWPEAAASIEKDYPTLTTLQKSSLVTEVKSLLGLSASLGYRTWTVRAYNTMLGSATSPYNIYLRLSTDYSSLLVFSPDTEKNVETELKENGNPTVKYVWLKIGELSAPSVTGTVVQPDRICTLDTGELDTASGVMNMITSAEWYETDTTDNTVSMKSGWRFSTLLANKVKSLVYGLRALVSKDDSNPDDKDISYALTSDAGEIEMVETETTLNGGVQAKATHPYTRYTKDGENKLQRIDVDNAVPTSAWIVGPFMRWLRSLFVRKDNADGTEEMQGSLKVDKDTSIVGDLNVDGDTTLKDLLSENITNTGDIRTKNLTVTGQAHFFELIIDKIKSVGGSAMFTAAEGFQVSEWKKVDGGYQIYWESKDASENMWQVGDQALCMNFKQAHVGVGHGVSNKYWWALVIEVGTDSVKKMHYIVISDNEAAGSDGERIYYDGTISIENGDDVVMCGHRPQAGEDLANELQRGNAIYIAASNSLDLELYAPLYAQYRGIRSFKLSPYRKSYFDARTAKFVGEFAVESEDGTEENLTSYTTYRKYSDNKDGSNMSDDSSKAYVGICVSGENAAPTDPTKYTWITNKAGVSIDTANTYIKYGIGASGKTHDDVTFGETIPDTTDSKPYVWTKTHTAYTDGNATDAYSVSRIGIDGKGVKSSVVTYYQSQNVIQPETVAENLWGDFPILVDGYWLYTRSVVTYSDGDTATSYSAVQNGKGSAYAGCSEYYKLGENGNTPPESYTTPGTYTKDQTIRIHRSWTTSRPTEDDYKATVGEGKTPTPYIWNFEISRDSAGNQYVTDPICVGNFSKGIKSVVETYAISTESVLSDAVKALTWTDEQQDAAPTEEKPYQWNKTETTYTDGSKDIVYHVSAVKGNKGNKGDDSVVYDLVLSSDQISFKRDTDGTTLTPASVTITATVNKTVGNTTTNMSISASGLTVRYAFTTPPAKKISGNAFNSTTGYTVNSSTTYAVLCLAAFLSDGTVVCRKSIPIIKDGTKGEKGNDGDDGNDGKDAISIVSDPASIEYSTEDNGLISAANQKKDILVSVYRGDTDVTADCIFQTPTAVNCTVGAGSMSDGKYKVSITAVSSVTQTATYNGVSEQVTMSATSGSVAVKFTYGGRTYTKSIPFSVNVNKFVNSFKVGLKEFRSEYTHFTSDDDGTIKQMQSSITQNAEKIALKVGASELGATNILKEASMLNETSDYYYFAKTGGTGHGCSCGLSDETYKDCGVAMLVAKNNGDTKNACYSNMYFRESKTVTVDGVSKSVQNIKLKPNTKHSLSFWAKANDATDNYYINVRPRSTEYDTSPTTVYATSGTPTTSSNAGVAHKIVLSSANQWTYCTMTFTTGNYDYCQLNIFSRSYDGTAHTLCISQPMLVEGDPCVWNAKGVTKEELLDTGIDVELGKITMTADDFKLMNNHGEESLSVDEEGNAMFAGRIRTKKGCFGGLSINQPTIITDKNVNEYLTFGWVYAVEAGESYRKKGWILDLEKCGTNVVFYSYDSNEVRDCPIALANGTRYGKISAAIADYPDDPDEAETWPKTDIFVQAPFVAHKAVYENGEGAEEKEDFSTFMYYFTEQRGHNVYLYTQAKQYIGNNLTIVNATKGSVGDTGDMDIAVNVCGVVEWYKQGGRYYANAAPVVYMHQPKVIHPGEEFSAEFKYLLPYGVDDMDMTAGFGLGFVESYSGNKYGEYKWMYMVGYENADGYDTNS